MAEMPPPTPPLRTCQCPRSGAFPLGIGAKWALFAAALAGCSAPPPPVKQPPVEVTPPVAPSEPSATPPEPEATSSLIDVTLPKDPACLVTGEFRPRKVDPVLRVAPFGLPFAEVEGGRGTLHFPAGPRPKEQALEVEADGLSVRGYIDSTTPALFTPAPTWLSGLALTTPYTLLDWTEAAAGNITVTTPEPPGLTLIGPKLSAIVPCSGASLDRKDFDATAAIDGYKKAKPRQWTLDHPIDISLTPGGPPVARALPDKYRLDISLLSAKGKDAKIAWEVGPVVVVGWVKITDIQMPRTGYGYGSGSGLGRPPRYADDYKKVVCPMDVDLLAVFNGEKTYIVGKIQRGTVIELTSVDQKLTHVRVRSEQLKPTVDTWWSVMTRDLDTCEPPKT